MISIDSVLARRRVIAPALALAPGLLFSGYAAARRAAMAILYKPVAFATGRVLRDLVYCEGSCDQKHRLDLFLPPGNDWPVLIFVHGGGLTAGDKSLRVSGRDVYGNIGRFYASHGIGVAVINYRLQPKVNWRAQVEDVAEATAWVFSHLGNYGADVSRLFLAGHSAGAQLSVRVALDPNALAQFGLSPSIIKGVIAVSGAGYDLADTTTYQLGAKFRQYAAVFRWGDTTDDWKREASPINFIAAGAPPFLLLYAKGETRPLQRQSQLLYAALQEKQIPSELVVIPGETHRRIVLTLSRPDKSSAPAILRFIENR
jgi:acetyl esterase/lipase